MPIDLYYTPGSAASRSVLLAAAAVGVDLNLKLTNLRNGDHLKPEFLKMNPQHTVPTMNDNGFCLWECRAIMGYLVDQYGKDDSLYPKEAKARALVNQRLLFDIGTLYQGFVSYYYKKIFGSTPADPAQLEKVEQAFGFLDKFLDGQDYVAGSNLTIADLCILATVSTYEVVEHDITKYPNVARWLAKMKAEVPKYKEANEEGCIAFKTYVDSMKK